MSDRWAVLAAVACVTGAFAARGPSPWAAALLVLVAVLIRWPPLLVVALFLLSGGLTIRAEHGMTAVRPGTYAGGGALLTDPDTARFGLRADVRLDDGRHVQAVAFAPDAQAALRDRRAGQHVVVHGRLERAPPMADWLTTRHIVGVLSIDTIDHWSPGAPWVQAANGLRATLERGAQALPERERTLFLGFVLGDTRGQPPDITDDFRGAGLSHLLAVSGQNVAFVMALAGPLLRGLRLRTRLLCTLTVIAFFALVTRFEPSVLRASAMAALAVTASTMGREATSLRLLGLAVGGLVLVDPFLVRSVGFQLSVAACIGIVVLSPAIARALPGPRFVAETLAVTLGAQAGVAPLLVSTFGGVPVAAVPANLLAAPAEAPVMVSGLVGGIAAGLVGGAAAAVVLWPTHLLIAWIGRVAHIAAAAPLGEMHGADLALVSVALLVAAGARHLGWRGVAAAAVALSLVGVAAPALRLRAEVPARA